MENLDPLRQKPDFLKYVSDKTGAMNDNCTVEDGCEYVWKDFVEPLMKELEAKDKEMDGLIEIHHMQDEDLKERFEEKESRIRELEEARDKFAIGFAEWIAKKSIDNTLPWTDTTAKLLELYKESLNQKP